MFKIHKWIYLISNDPWLFNIEPEYSMNSQNYRAQSLEILTMWFKNLKERIGERKAILEKH